MQVVKVNLIGGPGDGVVIEVPAFLPLVAVSPGGDAEAITPDEAADAVARGHDLYQLTMWESDGSSFTCEHVTLHDLLRVAHA